MAKYDRDILVPYLNNLYALHLARMRTQDRIRNIDEAEGALRRRCQVNEPEKPKPVRGEFYVVLFVAFVLILIGIFAFTLCIGFYIAAPEYGHFVKVGENALKYIHTPEVGYRRAWKALIFGIVITFCGILIIVARKRKIGRENRDRMGKWQKEKSDFERYITQSHEELQNNLPTLARDREFYRAHELKIEGLIDGAYSANVIPRQYRNIYAVYYLADYFSTSSADDVDTVLQTFVLEQIKDRLDRIIAQQEEIILNQQVAMADRIASSRSQEQFMREMAAKVDCLNASGEERNRYLAMIDSDVRATYWMATASYLRQ